MKKYLYLLLMPLLVIASCEKPEIEPEQDPVVGKITLKSDAAIVLSDEGSSEQVEFTATLDWKAVSDQEWLTVTPKAGMAGDASVTMSAEKNTLEESRNAIVTLSCGEDTKTIEVTQKQAGALLLTQSSIEVAAEGGTVTITAKSNSNATASVDASAMTWITEVKTKALVDYIFNFQITANESESPRSGKIVFENSDGKKETVTINQAGVYVAPEVIGNVSGKVTCNGEGLAGVLVSDGIQIVETDQEGNYQMASTKETKYVYVIMPSGYEAPTEGFLPKFHKVLTEDASTMEEANFELNKVDNDNFTLLVCGDMHLANRTNDVAQFEKVAVTINEVANSRSKVYAIALGDMTWEKYWIPNNFAYPEYISTMNSNFTNLPFYHTMGNHDNEKAAAGDFDKSFLFVKTFAPNYYSFNLGKIHFIVMDNLDFTDCPAGEEDYERNFTKAQLDWLVEDLKHVDKSTPVFVMMHEVLQRWSGDDWSTPLDGKDADLDDFVAYFEGYNVNVVSGHTHCMFNHEHAPNFVEFNASAVCGTWWWSGYRTPGIHLGQDGSPGGFGVFDFTGTDYTRYYQAACKSADYQFRAYDMNKVKEAVEDKYLNYLDGAAAQDKFKKYYDYILKNYAENDILVNVWDYDKEWTVTIEENGTPLNVSQVPAYDPLHVIAHTAERCKKDGSDPTFLTARWTHFFKANASSANSEIKVIVTDRNGKTYTETMTRPKVFSIDEYKNEVQRIKPKAEFKTASSSSLVFGWTTGGTAAEDAELPYKIALYKDAICTELVQSFDIPANLDKWEGNALRFAFGGLEPSTTYYFVVTNLENGDNSDVVEGRTEAFTVVDPSTVTNATAGTVLLAEDFSFIGWGNDQFAKAIGFIPNGDEVGTISGHKTTEDGYYQAAETVLTRLFSDRPITSDHRLYDWGYYGNSDVYILNGAIRVGRSTSGRRTHIVTPALTGIPAGKTATVDVTITSSIYDSSNEVGVFVEDYTALTKKEQGQFTGASLSNGYSQDADVKKWSTKTVRISGVDCNSCLLIGSLNDVDTKNRFFIDDVVVTLVELETEAIPDIEGVVAECIATSSSTLSFKWEETLEASELVQHAFTATLYKDAACTVVDQSYDFPAGLSAWKGKTPKYVFGGLQPSTDYWFKVSDTTANIESEPVKCTTDPFTHVQMPGTITSTGVVLAEDFGEIRWEFDHFTGAVGFTPSDKSDFANTAVEGFNNSGSKEFEFKSFGDAIKKSRLNGWLTDTYGFIHPGYIKLGTENAGGWVLTPAFTVPEGKKAVVKVTVTAARYNTNHSKDWMLAVIPEETAGVGKDGDHTAYLDWPDITDNTCYQQITFDNTDWATKSVEGLIVSSGDRIAFGTHKVLKDYVRSGYISDMVVEVLEIVDENRTTKVSILGDSISTFSGWSDSSKGGAYYPKTGCDVTSVDQTWWHRLIYNYMSTGTFEKNISAGNTTIVQNTTGDASAYWYGWDFGTRVQKLGLGDPDVIMVFGGTNDYGHILYNSTSEELIDGVAMGAETFPASSNARLEELLAAADAATTVAAADALDGTTYAGACIRLIQMLRVRHPKAKIVFIIGDYVYYGMGEVARKIVDHFSDDYVRKVDILDEYGYKASSAIEKFDYAHPTAAGMDVIASYVYEQVGEWIDENN